MGAGAGAARGPGAGHEEGALGGGERRAAELRLTPEDLAEIARAAAGAGVLGLRAAAATGPAVRLAAPARRGPGVGVAAGTAVAARGGAGPSARGTPPGRITTVRVDPDRRRGAAVRERCLVTPLPTRDLPCNAVLDRRVGRCCAAAGSRLLVRRRERPGGGEFRARRRAPARSPRGRHAVGHRAARQGLGEGGAHAHHGPEVALGPGPAARRRSAGSSRDTGKIIRVDGGRAARRPSWARCRAWPRRARAGCWASRCPRLRRGPHGLRVLHHRRRTTASSACSTTRRSPPGDQLGAPDTIFKGIPKGAIHNGGRIAFGPDKMLYAGTGETGDTRAGPGQEVPGRQDPADDAGRRAGARQPRGGLGGLLLRPPQCAGAGLGRATSGCGPRSSARTPGTS